MIAHGSNGSNCRMHLPGMLDAAMPELPGATGGAVPLTTKTGPAVPF